MNGPEKKYAALLDKLKFDDRGLIPAITQDVRDNQVLMLAWMNRESLALTLDTRMCHYWSRSRKELWKKGATSGNIQHVKWIKFDCDADCLLIGIEQEGCACHTGEYSCFHRNLEKNDQSEQDQ